MHIKKLSLMEELNLRKLITQITHYPFLQKRIVNNNIKFYIGFDPTIDSLHIGHLLLLITLLRFQSYGHSPYIILGGGTSIIGDPSFKIIKNKQINLENIKVWTDKIDNQLKNFFNTNLYGTVSIMNNYLWLRNINLLDFLNNIGKYFSINQMISRDTIKDRISNHNKGINYKEFTYTLLQSYDYLYLYKQYHIDLQIGGHDQWTNILSGINLIQKIYKRRAYGFTLPLLTNNNGEKFSKSQYKYNIWLDPKKTSPYKFYQFWINIPDVKVFDYIKMFTLLSLPSVKDLEKSNPPNGHGKKILAEALTKIVHGKEGLMSAKRITDSLFNKQNLTNLTINDFEQLKLDGLPVIYLKHKNYISVLDILLKSNLVTSKNQARYFIKSKAIKLNHDKIIYDPYYLINYNDKIYNKYTIISRGKKNYILICWI